MIPGACCGTYLERELTKSRLCSCKRLILSVTDWESHRTALLCFGRAVVVDDKRKCGMVKAGNVQIDVPTGLDG